MSIAALTVADCMAPARLTIKPETLITDAVRQMLDTSVIGGPVVDDSNKVVGFISEQDCLRYLISDSYYSEQSLQVKDVMKHDVLFTEPDMAIIDLAQLMCGNKPKKYPVCENGKLIGVISREHVLKALLG